MEANNPLGHGASSTTSVPLLYNNETRNGRESGLDEIESNVNIHHSSTASSPTSSLKTCFNGLNALSGIGILSVPYALASGGWLSLILLFVISMAAFYSALLMKRCMDVSSHIVTYPDIGDLAFGNKGRIFISVIMYSELYLVATGFLISEGDNLNNLFPDFGFVVMGLSFSGKQCFVVIVSLIIWPTVWLDVSLLSYVSASGILASFIILGSIFWNGAFDGTGFHAKGTVVVNWSGIPTAASLFAFCYCAHPVFPTLYNSMGNKHHFSNVLLVCFIICTFSYATIAILGYLMFGASIQSQITLNLPTKNISSRIAIYTTLVNPICKYALMLIPIVNAIKTWLPCQYYNKKPHTLLIGTALLISNVIVALIVPYFADLMSFIGSLLSVTASIILPCLCYLKISGPLQMFGCETILIVSIILMGVMITIVGTYTSLVDLIKLYA